MPQWNLIGRTATLAAGFALAATVLFAPLETVAQQSSACQLLERELAAYDTVQRDGPEVARLNQTIAQQRNALTTTEGHARRIGCYKRGFLFFQPSRPPECPRLLNTVEQMRRNLSDLTARRDRIAGPIGANDPGKQRILRLLADNRCGPQYSQFANAGRSRGLFGPLFEEDSGPQAGWQGGFWSNRSYGGAPTYRTLCVRTCDGYYFPISFAVRPEHFETDAQQCRARCPSAVVELYVYENPGGTVDQAVSLSGKPYASIPTAFLYRKEYVQGCSCNPYTLALEKAEQLAAKTDPTVKVPDIVPQDETGAPTQLQGSQTQGGQAQDGQAQTPPASGSDQGQGDVSGLNIFRGGEEPNFLSPFPSSQDGTPNIIRIPPSGAADQGFSTAPQDGTGAPFQDPQSQQ